MSIIRKNPAAAGLSDPSLVRKAEATLAQDVLLTKGKPGVVNGAVVLTSTTLTTTSNSFTTTTSANNQSADTVTVYNTAGAVYVSSIDQTVRQNIVNNPVAGVSKIIAGNNITITSTNGDGTGNVTVNVSGLGNIVTANFDGNASNVLHGDGSWSADTTTYGNSNVVSLLSAFGSNTITTTGNVSVGNIIATNIGNIATINLTGSTSNVLYGNGVFAAVAGGANTGNVTFNDINIIGTGNLKLQPNSATSESLDIYLTAAADIHIAGSGNVILGTDEQANVAVLLNGNVAIQAGNVSGTQTWNFGTDGYVTFPRDAVANTDPILTILGGPSPQILSEDASLAGPANLAIVSNYLNFSGSNGNKIVVYADDGEVATDANMVLTTNLANAGNTHSWTFDSNGVLSLAKGNSTIESVANSAGDLSGLSTLQLMPDSSTTDDRYLIVDPTGPNHIHIRAGGNIDNSNVMLILGGETSSFRVDAGLDPNVYITANSLSWTFGNNGNLTLPNNTVAINFANGSSAFGNIVATNLDGNVSNVLRGDGTWSADANSAYGDSNVVTLLGAFGSNTIVTTGGANVGDLVSANANLGNAVTANYFIGGGGNIAYQQTNTFYVDPGRSDTYTAIGTPIQPFKTITAAISAAVTAGYTDSNPAFIVLMENITENVTLQPGIWLTSLGTGTHGSPVITGTVTVTSSTGSTVTNHYSLSNLRIVAPTNGHGILFTGTAPQRLYVRDMWIDANGTGDGIYMDNIGSGSVLHLDIAHLTHSGSGDIYCINVTKGNCYVTAIETTGATQVSAVQTGAVMTIDGSELDAVGDVVCETYGTGSLTITNSIITNTQVNGNGIKINDAGSTVTVGQCLFSIPTGTGSAVWYNSGAALYGSNFAFASISFFPGTNTTIDARLLPIPLTVAVGTIAAPIIVGDITATGTAQDWDLIDNNASALSFDTTGKAGIINIVTTNSSEGVTMSGYANVTGNVTGGNISTAGQIKSTQAGNLSDGGGQLYLNGSGNNRVDFNTNGTGAPTFTTRSAGAKVVLYPSIGASATDYAMGVDSGALWSGIPAADGGQFFKWYAGTTEVANLSGTGMLTVTGNIQGANLIGTLANGSSNISMTTSGNVNVTANATSWTFGTNGNLTLPEGGIVTNNIPPVTFTILVQYDDLVWSGNTLTFTNASSGYMLQVLALMQIGDIITLNSTPTTVTGTYTGGGAGTFTVSGTGSGQQITTFTLPNRLTSVNGVTLTTNSKNYLFTEAGVTQSPVLTVDALPAGVYAAAGFRAFVSDANLVPVGNFGAIVGNSGSNTVCVWCDGTNWRIG